MKTPNLIALCLLTYLIAVNIARANVDIPDPSLRKIIERVLHKEPNEAITEEDMLDIRQLWTNSNIGDNPINDLTGIEHAHNLRTLWDLSGIELWHKGENTEIKDLSPLTHLVKLEEIIINAGSVTNLLPLSNLTRMTALKFVGDSLSDISALSKWRNLKDLDIEGGKISDISVLSSLTGLRTVSLEGNAIADITAIANLTNLETLFLNDNQISDMSPIGSCTKLTFLGLKYNSITNISAVKTLEKLEFLSLEGNSIRDISAVQSLYTLESLNLKSNDIMDITYLLNNRGLRKEDSQIHLDNNPLSYLAMCEHIPMLDLDSHIFFTKQMPKTDTNQDLVINILDLIIVSNNIGIENPDMIADVNGDETINVIDLVMVTKQIGQSCKDLGIPFF